MQLTIQQRWEIIFLHFNRLGPKLPIRTIAKELKYSRLTVETWINRYKKTGDIQDEERQGRKRKTSEVEDKNITTITKRLRTRSSTRISTLISKQGINVSPATVRRRLNEVGLHKLHPLKKPLLSDTHIDKRLKWARKNTNTDWTNIIFTDETTISQFYKPKKVWRLKGEIVKVPTVKHSAKVHVWGCFSDEGFGNIYCFTENLNANLLCTIYKKTLLPSAKKLFGKDNNNWKLQEDNDPKHKSKKAAEWREENNIERISWPAQSPDLNPMENVWAVLKANVSDYEPNSIADLIRIIKKEWKKLDKMFAKNLIISMKNRISLVKLSKGDHILY